MPWRISGTYAAACSCALVCPCWADGRPLDPEGRGECRGAIVFDVRQGNLNDVDLSGVRVAFYNYFPSNLSAGNWTVGLVVDEAASDEQVSAVERIFSGREGGAFADFGPLIGEYVGMQRAPITYSNGDTPSVTVGGNTELRFEPLRGPDGSPTTVRNAAFGFAPEFRIGKATGRSDAFGLTFSPQYGEAAEFEFTSEGTEGVRARA